MAKHPSFQSISVIVPQNPFLVGPLQEAKHCLTALDVEKLMEWWPGTPHSPHRDAAKVKAIQRSLDWKRVAQIAAYLLQEEVVDAPAALQKCFSGIYEPKSFDPGRQWPPRVPKVVGFQRSEYPTFSNVLLHVNGAQVTGLDENGAAKLVFDEADRNLYFSVIDGQHRINGAYFAINIRKQSNAEFKWQIPAEVFLDLDARGKPPRRQAQIFIDVNFYQKKVDRSLVADLFPTARGKRDALDDKERAQDLGRKLMLETGPLVGMIQIPGIKYGVKDVVTLSTLNSAIEDVIPFMRECEIESLEEQAEFLAQCLDAWLIATGRKEVVDATGSLDASNVVYQGRVLVSYLSLLPACIWRLKSQGIPLISDKARDELASWLKRVATHAGLMEKGKFIDKSEFKEHEFLGSGGIGRFRDTLWAAAISGASIGDLSAEERESKAEKNRSRIYAELRTDDDH